MRYPEHPAHVKSKQRLMEDSEMAVKLVYCPFCWVDRGQACRSRMGDRRVLKTSHASRLSLLRDEQLKWQKSAVSETPAPEDSIASLQAGVAGLRREIDVLQSRLDNAQHNVAILVKVFDDDGGKRSCWCRTCGDERSNACLLMRQTLDDITRFMKEEGWS